MTLEELRMVKESLQECKPSVEDFSWADARICKKRKIEAMKILRRAIKELKNKENF